LDTDRVDRFGPSGEAIDPQQAREGEEARTEMLARALVQKMQDKINLRISQRKDTELRLLDDLRQYHGKYPPEKAAKIVAAGGSDEFVNITRPKTNQFIARLQDMLLPTDDKNWGIEPTPVPSIDDQTDSKEPLTDPSGQQIQTPEGHPVEHRDVAAGVLEVAKQRCLSMEREIDDQLEEAKYNSVQRDVIKDIGVYGTGILKGPTHTNRVKKSWRRVGADSAGVVQYELTIEEDKAPGVEKVSVWNFFPDMSVTELKQCEDILERHPSTRKDLSELAKIPGFNADAIRRLIKQGPQKTSSLWYMNELRAISGNDAVNVQATLWEVWEYHGPLSTEELKACGIEAPDDPLLMTEVVVWYCDGEILKAVLNPSDSGDRPYSVSYCEKDDSSIFGFGYPYLLRNPQNVANGAWRMIIDNAGLSVGPQLIINRKAITPLDGNYALRPRKVWEISDNAKADDVFKAINIDSHQQELRNLFDMANAMADQETNLPQIAGGQDSPDQPDTFGGLQIQNNNASVVLRRSVKSYDDDMTLTLLPRFVDWNMQHNPKEEIKGDNRIVAKGAGVLLEKERQAQAIMTAVQVINQDPDAAVLVDKQKIYTDWFRALRLQDAMLDEDGVKEAQQKQQAAQQQQQGQPAGGGRGWTPEELDFRNRDLQFREKKHSDELAVSVHELATKFNLDEKQILAHLAETRMKLDHDAKKFNASRNFHDRTGEAVGP
jgi:hypothetical protein